MSMIICILEGTAKQGFHADTGTGKETSERIHMDHFGRQG